jgi:PAS domain S-box-containing protein
VDVLPEPSATIEEIETCARLGTWEFIAGQERGRISTGLARLLGVAPGTVPSVAEVLAWIIPTDRERTQSELGAAFANGGEYRTEFRLRRPDTGAIITLQATGTVTTLPDGRPCLRGVLQDITGLRQREDLYRTLVGAMAEGAVVQDAQDRILETNRSLERILGLTANQLRGLDSFDPRWKAIREDGSPFQAGEHPSIVTLRTGQPCSDVIMGVCKPDGSRSWVSINSRPVGTLPDGLPEQVVVTLSDITARFEAERTLQQSQALLEATLSNLPMPVWSMGADWFYQLENAAAIRQFGDIRGMHFEHHTVPEALKDRWRENNRRALAGEQVVDRQEWTVAGRKHSSVDLLAPVLIAERITGIVGIHLDLSEQAQARHDLAVANAGLEQRVTERTADLAAAYAELEAFSYSVSHDLRAPLRAIDGFSLAVLDDHAHLLPPEGREMLTRVRLASQRMGNLIDGLLRLSQVSRGELRSVEVDISRNAQEKLEALAQAEPQRRVAFAVEPGITLHGDPDLWRIALDNLLDNAWKYTSRKAEAHISLARARQADRSGFVVSDDGVGFDMRYANRLFSAFQRMHRPEEFGGHGIGLATVHRIVRRHRGSITADAAPNCGARFTILL